MIAADKMRDAVLLATGAGAIAGLTWLASRSFKKSNSYAETVDTADAKSLFDAIRKRDESVLAYADAFEEKTRRGLMERGSKKIAPSFMILKQNLIDGHYQHVDQHIDDISSELESMGVPTRM